MELGLQAKPRSHITPVGASFFGAFWENFNPFSLACHESIASGMRGPGSPEFNGGDTLRPLDRRFVGQPRRSMTIRRSPVAWCCSAIRFTPAAAADCSCM